MGVMRGRISMCANTPRRSLTTSSPIEPPSGTLPEEADGADADVYIGGVTPRLLSEREKKVVAYRQEYKCAGCEWGIGCARLLRCGTQAGNQSTVVTFLSTGTRPRLRCTFSYLPK